MLKKTNTYKKKIGRWNVTFIISSYRGYYCLGWKYRKYNTSVWPIYNKKDVLKQLVKQILEIQDYIYDNKV